MKKMYELHITATVNEETGELHVEGSCEVHDNDVYDRLLLLNSVVDSLQLDPIDIMAFSVAKMEGVFDQGDHIELVIPWKENKEDES